MADTRITQKQNESLTYIDSWAIRLSTAYPAAPVTIASATGSASAGTLTAVSGTGTAITFHLATSAVTPPTDTTVTLTATLSNGDVSIRTLIVGVTA